MTVMWCPVGLYTWMLHLWVLMCACFSSGLKTVFQVAWSLYIIINRLVPTSSQITFELHWVSEWVKSLSRVWLFTTPWTVAYQAPPSMGFSRQEYWSGLPFPSPEDLPDPGIERRSPAFQADALTSEPPELHWSMSNDEYIWRPSAKRGKKLLWVFGRVYCSFSIHHDPSVLGGPTRHGLISLS